MPLATELARSVEANDLIAADTLVGACVGRGCRRRWRRTDGDGDAVGRGLTALGVCDGELHRNHRVSLRRGEVGIGGVGRFEDNPVAGRFGPTEPQLADRGAADPIEVDSFTVTDALIASGLGRRRGRLLDGDGDTVGVSAAIRTNGEFELDRRVAIRCDEGGIGGGGA